MSYYAIVASSVTGNENIAIHWHCAIFRGLPIAVVLHCYTDTFFVKSLFTLYFIVHVTPSIQCAAWILLWIPAVGLDIKGWTQWHQSSSPNKKSHQSCHTRFTFVKVIFNKVTACTGWPGARAGCVHLSCAVLANRRSMSSIRSGPANAFKTF